MTKNWRDYSLANLPSVWQKKFGELIQNYRMYGYQTDFCDWQRKFGENSIIRKIHQSLFNPTNFVSFTVLPIRNMQYTFKYTEICTEIFPDSRS